MGMGQLTAALTRWGLNIEPARAMADYTVAGGGLLWQKTVWMI